MIYVKSFLVGLLTLLIVVGSLPILGFFVLMIDALIHPSTGRSVGWDPISLYRHSPLLPLALIAIVFASGFIWEYHRLTHR